MGGHQSKEPHINHILVEERVFEAVVLPNVLFISIAGIGIIGSFIYCIVRKDETDA